MNTLKQLVLLFSFLVVTGCATVGPTLIIEPAEPAEDFVVICSWSTGIGVAHGGGSTIDEDVHVISSGEELSCGVNPFGRATSSVYHPIYTGWNTTIVDGVEIIKPITIMQYIDEQKAKFEAGYWDAHKGNLYSVHDLYIKTLISCGVSESYLDDYSKVKKVKREYFKQKYNDVIYRCKQKYYEEKIKHDSSVSGRSIDIKYLMDKQWEPARWSKYE